MAAKTTPAVGITIRVYYPIKSLLASEVSSGTTVVEACLGMLRDMGYQVEASDPIVTRRPKLPLPVTAVEEGHADEAPDAGEAGAGRLVDRPVLGVPFPRAASKRGAV